MRIPRLTRIILIPEEEQGAREYCLSRRMAVALLLLAALALVAVLVLLMSFTARQNTLSRLGELEHKLETTQIEAKTVKDLQQELDDSKRLQEKLLYMLGVKETPSSMSDSLGFLDDSFVPSAGGEQGGGGKRAQVPEPGLWPAAGQVTREFDRGNTLSLRRPHLGIDIAGPQDTPIFAVAPGEVSRAGKDDFLGNYVEIRHGLGYLTVYGHCARIAVTAGERVQGGQVIAYMGKSGQATATHLHFEIWRDGEAVDPRRYLTGEPPPR